MAEIKTVRFVDDLDGSEAVGTVRFSLENRAYEIDLSDENTDKLHDALAQFIEHARPVKGHGKPDKGNSGSGGNRGRRTTTDRAETQRIREWARQKGIEINERGRIPKSVVEQYQAA